MNTNNKKCLLKFYQKTLLIKPIVRNDYFTASTVYPIFDS